MAGVDVQEAGRTNTNGYLTTKLANEWLEQTF